MAEVIESLSRLDVRAGEEDGGDAATAATAVFTRAPARQPGRRRWLTWAGAAAALGLLGAVAATQLPRERQEPAAGDEAPVETAVEAAPAPRTSDPKLREHLALARFFADRGEYDDAIGAYEEALAIEPGNAAATKGRAQARRARAAEQALLAE